DPETAYLAELDGAQLRVRNGYPPNANLAEDGELQIEMLKALPQALLLEGGLAVALDFPLITEAVFDGETAAVVTPQSFSEIKRSLLERDSARVDGALVVSTPKSHTSEITRPYAVASGGDHVVIFGEDPAAVRAMAERTDGRIPAKLRRALDAGDGPIRIACLNRSRCP
ncbi:MAG TPA: hypothetical protein VFE52_07330, partial [Devosia sp.]|nr:hypothetical protein [Devosia sp.]